MKNRFFLLFALFLFSCGSEKDSNLTGAFVSNSNEIVFDVRELMDEEYADNPDIGFRSSNYRWNGFERGKITDLENGVSTLSFYGESGDTITLNELDLMEFIPTLPSHVKSDDYLAHISIINQEWNRNQVRFGQDEFICNNDDIVRIDLARNCLNAYLWEIITYVEEDGKQMPETHGWFNFPSELYKELFETKNQTPFERYKEGLENWIDPENNEINLALLRRVDKRLKVKFLDLSDEMYPLAGAREKKRKEIIYPVNFKTMRELQNDNTTFATFSVPGYYNRADPRSTELGRLFKLEDLILNKIESDSNLYEIVFSFSDQSQTRRTKLYLGGINLEEMPALKPEDCNKGWKNSMGIGNHTFYETYAQHEENKAAESPYYALLTDGNNRWLDSHKIGIDGPVIHRDIDDPSVYHVWLLSFERHAFVGHYRFTIKP